MVRRDNTQRRRPGNRQPKNRVLVVCCGARTEKQYLDGMRRHFRDSPIAVVVRPEAGAPSQLVDYAAKVWQRDIEGFDEVWCVFDVDDFEADIPKAVSMARRAKISLAISNPCFEFWLLLHFKEHSAWLNGPTGAMAKLCEHLTGYDKAKLDFGVVAAGIRRPRCGGSRRPSSVSEAHSSSSILVLPNVFGLT